MSEEIVIRLTREQAKWLRGTCWKIDDRYDDSHARPVADLLSAALDAASGGEDDEIVVMPERVAHNEIAERERKP